MEKKKKKNKKKLPCEGRKTQGGLRFCRDPEKKRGRLQAGGSSKTIRGDGITILRKGEGTFLDPTGGIRREG